MRAIEAKRLALCFAFLATAAPGWAEKPTIIPLATSSQWRFEKSRKLDVKAIAAWGGDPALESEYGVKSVDLRTYTLYPENKPVQVIEEEAQDASSAYGLMTLYTTEDMTALPDLPLTVVGKGSALMARGRNFMRVILADSEANSKPPGREVAITQGQLLALLRIVGGSGPSADDLKNLPIPLPSAGLVQGTEKYLLGLESARRVLPSFRSDLIGFTQGAEVRVARYRNGQEQVRILAITYPTPQIARIRFEALEKLLNVNQDKGKESIYGKRTGSYVILTLDAGSQKSAQNVLGRFVMTGSVSWNERYPDDDSTVIQMVRLVLANIFLTSILAAFALVGGLLFFLSKIAARRWFPNTAWGQPDEATITRLNLE
jgi:Family of unknown function (DUF6599)